MLRGVAADTDEHSLLPPDGKAEREPAQEQAPDEEKIDELDDGKQDEPQIAVYPVQKKERTPTEARGKKEEKGYGEPQGKPAAAGEAIGEYTAARQQLDIEPKPEADIVVAELGHYESPPFPVRPSSQRIYPAKNSCRLRRASGSSSPQTVSEVCVSLLTS